MKSRKLSAAVVAALAVMALSVFGPGGYGSGVSEAKGPNKVGWDAKINDGAVVAGGVGTSVGTSITFGLDAGNPVPSDVGFFDSSRTQTKGLALQAGPGLVGSAFAAVDVGSKSGTIAFSIKTNQMLALGGSGNIPTSGAFKGYVPNCGDNSLATTTRDYTGGGLGANEQVLASKTFNTYVGNMIHEASGLRPTGLFSTSIPAFVPAEYGTDTAPGDFNALFVQSYDDDNNNGRGDSQPGEPGGTAEPSASGAGDAPDPFATGGGGTAYVTGAAQDQHDYNSDGLPNGVQYMPDFLPVLADALGLTAFWKSRTYGIADVFTGLTPPTDVHFLGFAGVPGVGGIQYTVLTNPFAPSLAGSQASGTCSPFSVTVEVLATTVVEQYCTGCGVPAPMAGAVARSAQKSILAASATDSVDFYVSDADDYDQDGKVAPLDLCPRSADNTDPDNDLTSGVCDAAPASADNDGDTVVEIDTVIPIGDGTGDGTGPGEDCVLPDTCDNDVDGDGFINNSDNCETLANVDQKDDDGDTVGDLCDANVGADLMSGFPDPINISGAGSGTNTAGGLDNDLLCKDPFKHNLAENFGDGVAVGKCTIVQDAGGNGTVDIEDNANNEDRDTDAFLRETPGGAGTCTNAADDDGDTLVDMADPGCNYSDASEAAVGSNPLNPTDKPCVAGNKVVLWRTAGPLLSALADTDNDLLLDQCETLEGTTYPLQDSDGDGIFDGIEVGLGVNPLASSGAHAVAGADSDGDGCTNAQEKGDDPNVGGLRHPGNYWDNPDLNGDGGIDALDVLLISFTHYGHAFDFDAVDHRLDRAAMPLETLNPIVGGSPAFMVEASDGVDLTDAVAVLALFGQACGVAPGPPPITGTLTIP